MFNLKFDYYKHTIHPDEKKVLLNLILILLIQTVFAQEVTTFLYKGTTDKIPVTLCLIESVSVALPPAMKECINMTKLLFIT